MTNPHAMWFQRVTRHDSNRQVSEKAGISPATLGRQLKAGELTADLIIKIAEAYNESPTIALVDLGFMSSRWITEQGVVTALSKATDEELTDELLRRLKLLDSTPVDQLAARRTAKNTPAVPDAPYDDGTVRPWDDTQPHAADNSPDEDKLRWEEENPGYNDM